MESGSQPGELVNRMGLTHLRSAPASRITWDRPGRIRDRSGPFHAGPSGTEPDLPFNNPRSAIRPPVGRPTDVDHHSCFIWLIDPFCSCMVHSGSIRPMFAVCWQAGTIQHSLSADWCTYSRPLSKVTPIGQAKNEDYRKWGL